MKEIHLVKQLNGSLLPAYDSDKEMLGNIKAGEIYKYKFLKPRKSTRSQRQNKYYWGVIVAYWKELLYTEWGEYFTIEETHNFLKTNFNYKEIVNEDTGEILRKLKSTTENDTSEMEVCYFFFHLYLFNLIISFIILSHLLCVQYSSHKH